MSLLIYAWFLFFLIGKKKIYIKNTEDISVHLQQFAKRSVFQRYHKWRKNKSLKEKLKVLKKDLKQLSKEKLMIN